MDSKNDISLLEQLEIAKKKGCNVIVGLHTSASSLIAGPWLKKNRIVGVTSTATAYKLTKYFPYIISTMVPSDYFVKKTIDFVKKREPKKIFIIKFIDSIYSKIIAEQMKERFQGNVKVLEIFKGSILPIKYINEIKKAKKSSVIFTGFFYLCLPVLDQLAKIASSINKNESFIIGSPEWSFSTKLFLRKDIFKKIKNIHTTIVWDKDRNTKLTKNFVTEYKSKYNEFPHQVSAFTYDALTMVLNCSKGSRGNVNKVNNCLKRKKKFWGVTGKFMFDGKRTHSYKEIFMTRVLEDELKVIE